MSAALRFLRRDPAQIQPWAETCGQIRCLIEEKDGAAGEVHYVEIQEAKLHYHQRTDEFYYVIDGQQFPAAWVKPDLFDLFSQGTSITVRHDEAGVGSRMA